MRSTPPPAPSGSGSQQQCLTKGPQPRTYSGTGRRDQGGRGAPYPPKELEGDFITRPRSPRHQRSPQAPDICIICILILATSSSAFSKTRADQDLQQQEPALYGVTSASQSWCASAVSGNRRGALARNRRWKWGARQCGRHDHVEERPYGSPAPLATCHTANVWDGTWLWAHHPRACPIRRKGRWSQTSTNGPQAVVGGYQNFPKATKVAKPRNKHKGMHLPTPCKDEHNKSFHGSVVLLVVSLFLLGCVVPSSVGSIVDIRRQNEENNDL